MLLAPGPRHPPHNAGRVRPSVLGYGPLHVSTCQVLNTDARQHSSLGSPVCSSNSLSSLHTAAGPRACALPPGLPASGCPSSPGTSFIPKAAPAPRTPVCLLSAATDASCASSLQPSLDDSGCANESAAVVESLAVRLRAFHDAWRYAASVGHASLPYFPGKAKDSQNLAGAQQHSAATELVDGYTTFVASCTGHGFEALPTAHAILSLSEHVH